MNITWLEQDELIPATLRKIEDVDTVLDIGCGIRPQEYVVPKTHICCDPFQRY